MDEEPAAVLRERIESRGECVQVEQLRARDAQAGESVPRLTGCERDDATACRCGQLEDAVFPRLHQLAVDAERGLQGDDGAVELEPVHLGKPVVELVRFDVEPPRGRSDELERPPAQAWWLRARCKRGEERRRPEMLVDVGRRHGYDGIVARSWPRSERAWFR